MVLQEQKILKRRPDLWRASLSCSNFFKRVVAFHKAFSTNFKNPNVSTMKSSMQQWVHVQMPKKNHWQFHDNFTENLAETFALTTVQCSFLLEVSHPVSEFHFCFNWGLSKIGCHTQVGSNSTILTTFLSFWYRKFTFWYYSQNFVSIKWPHPKLAPSRGLNRGETPGTGWSIHVLYNFS